MNILERLKACRQASEIARLGDFHEDLFGRKPERWPFCSVCRSRMAAVPHRYDQTTGDVVQIKWTCRGLSDILRGHDWEIYGINPYGRDENAPKHGFGMTQSA